MISKIQKIMRRPEFTCKMQVSDDSENYLTPKATETVSPMLSPFLEMYRDKAEIYLSGTISSCGRKKIKSLDFLGSFQR